MVCQVTIGHYSENSVAGEFASCLQARGRIGTPEFCGDRKCEHFRSQEHLLAAMMRLGIQEELIERARLSTHSTSPRLGTRSIGEAEIDTGLLLKYGWSHIAHGDVSE